MHSNARILWQKYRALITLLTCVACSLALALLIVHVRTKALITSLESTVSTQQAVMMMLATTTVSNGADAVTAAIVTDCTLDERGQFDGLLGRLDAGLSKAELQSLDRLLPRCGDYFATKKSLMAARLVREVMVYETYVTQLEAVTGKELKETYRISDWQALARAEAQQGELQQILVSQQDAIISALRAGKTVDDEEIKNILTDVKETRTAQIVANNDAVAKRTALGVK